MIRNTALLLLLTATLAACSKAPPPPTPHDIKRGLSSTSTAPHAPSSAIAGAGSKSRGGTPQKAVAGGQPEASKEKEGRSAGIDSEMPDSRAGELTDVEVLSTKLLPEGWYEVEVRRGKDATAKTTRLLMRREQGEWVTQEAANHPALAPQLTSEANSRAEKKAPTFELRFETKTSK